MNDQHPTTAVFFAMLRRDIRVARRELPFFLLRTALQPLMLMVVFGYLLPKMGMMQAGYTSTLLPGVLALSLALSAVQSVALPMVAQFGFS
jgi:ABC-2 type transport system permease protein